MESADRQFVERFERAEFGPTEFPHRAHLRMGWIYVREVGRAAAVEQVSSGIRTLVTSHGQANRYHDTLTRAWVYVIALAVEANPQARTFDEFIELNPQLLDKGHLLEYYSPTLLSSPAARSAWVSPDVRRIEGAP